MQCRMLSIARAYCSNGPFGDVRRFTLRSAAPPQDRTRSNCEHTLGSALGRYPGRHYDSGVLSAVQPSWQASAISTYLKTATGLPDAKLFNATGRGFPDVAAQVANANANAMLARQGASLSRTASWPARLGLVQGFRAHCTHARACHSALLRICYSVRLHRPSTSSWSMAAFRSQAFRVPPV